MMECMTLIESVGISWELLVVQLANDDHGHNNRMLLLNWRWLYNTNNKDKMTCFLICSVVYLRKPMWRKLRPKSCTKAFVLICCLKKNKYREHTTYSVFKTHAKRKHSIFVWRLCVCVYVFVSVEIFRLHIYILYLFAIWRYPFAWKHTDTPSVVVFGENPKLLYFSIYSNLQSVSFLRIVVFRNKKISKYATFFPGS